MTNLTGSILRLMQEAEELKRNSSQKKEINKIIARLEEAWLWSKQLTASPAQEISETCTCPLPNVVDTACPIHGQR